MGLRLIVVLCMLSALVIPAAVNAAPIRINFNACRNATYAQNFLPNATILSYSCCPVLPTKPILTGLPPPLSPDIRIRPAAQCTDAAYKEKLERAYALMEALPDDDPRSLTQQWYTHCSHCGGAFFSDINNASTAIDIHFSWLFHPWHRYFLYFHERILQGLLGDPTFSLNFWNWDGPFTVGDGTSTDGKCLLAGQNFPSLYQDPGSSVYDDLRSNLAKGTGQFPFPSLTFSPFQSAAEQYLPNRTAFDWIQSNLNVMYNAMVSGATTPEIFLGKVYREGDPRGVPSQGPGGGGGSLELTAHAGVHFWTGSDPPFDLRDMGSVATAARDPVFFSHHGNVDRLFQVWRDIGPLLGEDREYYNDPDFLNAEFLFYDENKDLWRVSVKDALDTRNLGYVYQDTIYPWLKPNITSCAGSDYNSTMTQALALGPPTRAADGNYHVSSGNPFVIVLDRPATQGLEEFLIVSGITFDAYNNGGFDVYVDLLYPTSYNTATACAEYCGRFSNMVVIAADYQPREQFVFKTSITRTLADINVPSSATQIVVTLLSMAPSSSQSVGFNQIYISNS